jgi:hypothetical protein
MNANSSSLVFLKFTARILWQSLLLLFVPAALALIVVVPLAFVTKSIRIEAEAVTSQVSFNLIEGSNGGQDVALLQSVRGSQISILTKSIEIPVRKLVDKDQGKSVLENDAVEFRTDPQNSTESCETEFAENQEPIYLQAVRLRPGSTVFLRRNDDELFIELTPKELVEARIALPESDVSLTATNCLIVDKNGKALSGLTESPQHRFTLDAPSQVEIASNDKTVFRILLAPAEDKDLQGAFGSYFPVDHLQFPPGTGPSAVPIAQGFVRFREIDKQDVKLDKSFVQLSSGDPFEVTSLNGNHNSLDMAFTGIASSVKIGKAPSSNPEELPDLLDWIYRNQKLGLIAGALVWASGTVLASLNLWDAMKKLRD